MDSQTRADILLQIADAIDAEKRILRSWTAWIMENP